MGLPLDEELDTVSKADGARDGDGDGDGGNREIDITDIDIGE